MTTRHSPPASPSAPRSRAWLVGALLLAAAPIGLAVAPVPADAQTASGVDDLALAPDGFRFRELGPATESHGSAWTPVLDDQPTASIGAVAVAPSNPNVVWVGTGEPQNRQSSPYGGGVFRSLDAGRAWEPVGLEETRHVGRIVIHPRDPEVVYVAAVGHLWGPSEERGVYRTTDGGETGEEVLYIDEHTGAIDLVMDRNDLTPWAVRGWIPGSTPCASSPEPTRPQAR